MTKAGALNKIKQSEMDKLNTIQLSNGITLVIRRIPPAVMVDIMTDINNKRPKVPVTYIENLGREEENPHDIDYIEAVQAFKVYQTQAVSDAFLVRGTKLHQCPAGIPGPNDEGEWVEDVEALGKAVPKAGRRRYLMWLKNVALEDADDYGNVMAAVGRKSGVAEEDVQAAAEAFRGDESGHPDLEGEASE